MEAAILEAEAELEALRAEMQSPDVVSDGARLQASYAKLQDGEARVEEPLRALGGTGREAIGLRAGVRPWRHWIFGIHQCPKISERNWSTNSSSRAGSPVAKFAFSFLKNSRLRLSWLSSPS